jgi:5-methylcytosine-specific restriction endonuclease McrBC regulatory subunit McrC
MLDMEVFFEAWVETLAEWVARSTGSRLRVGRRGETRASLVWHPSHAGSLRPLVPDAVLERDDTALVLDAKYKRHAEQIDRDGWGRVAETVRERHRADVHQALAYSTLFEAPRVVTCLVYPMSDDAFRSLVERGQVVTHARVPAGHRRVELAIVAAPMSASPDDTTRALEELVRAPLE